MTFLTMQTELSDRLGAYDVAVPGDLVKLKRWLNMATKYICGKKFWPFLLAEEIIQTVPDVTTGTVSVNAADTAITFSSGPVASVANRYIKFSSSNNWYKITSHTAASTSAVISPAYAETTNLTAGTFTVRKLLYTTTTPLIQIIDMKQMVTPVRLISQSPRETDFFSALYYDAGNPYFYVMSSPDSSGNLQFSFLQSPSTAMNIHVRGIQNITDMSSDSDVSIIPAPWHDGIVNIAAFYGFQSLDDTRAADELKIGELRIQDMANNYAHDAGRHRIMRPVDSDANFGLQFALPSNFGPEWP